MNRATKNGFTLVELLVTVAIVGILAAVAMSNYRDYVIRSNRTAAQSVMYDIANRQQQWLVANRTYVASTDGDWQTAFPPSSMPTAVTRNYTYTVALGVGGVPSFIITFTPTTTGANANDGVLTLTNAGVKGVDPAKWKS